ncbi:unnamed protein product [Zymoseptoria tritici ST99CH_3D7]|uniref:N-acetyltransferase domain-containing protein n=1 Tax=Zymoseptoria tritici (strain ST99CH_3D7) TaxID=1276538 RepID=A0A1X7S8Z7_ZYMT9|nr:unnamed protein product [Zymoseptoria tritici ST99CH_3D7]
MSTKNPPRPFTIQTPTPPLIPSMTTIVARAFHPVNAFHRRAFPLTPGVLAWFHRAFTDEIQNPRCHPLVAIDPSVSTSSSLHVIGLLLLRRMSPTEPGAGMWSLYPYTADHDASLFGPANEAQSRWRRKLFDTPGEPHYGKEHLLVELFGADHGWKGTGVGKALLGEACGVADREGWVMLVEANGSARGFYEKFGFEEVAREKMPSGEMEYWEFLLVREVGGGGGGGV